MLGRNFDRRPFPALPAGRASHSWWLSVDFSDVLGMNCKTEANAMRLALTLSALVSRVS